MKKHFLSGILTILFISVFLVSHAQTYYVKVQPVAPVVVRPVAPTPHHIWVADEWTWRQGAYVHVSGYWALPPRGHVRWIPGHWKYVSGHGHYWVPGHWV
jgi:hypothetical protein